jgi:Xaa-Pro aminopeptidase
MTRETYSPDRIDRLALRVFDCAADLRAIAEQMRSEQLDALVLHDKKALEYLARLEDWIHKGHAVFQVEARRARGQRRARSVTAEFPAP